MNQGASVSEVMNPGFKEFFQAHQDVYGNNHYRQGLFLLGTVISQIVYEQRKKRSDTKMSSTFMKKLNFDGIPPRRIKGLINEIREFANIYDVFETPGLWGNIMDRLQGIEDSRMKGDEVVFYILTGVSFNDYLGMKYAQEKKLSDEANH